MLYLSHCLKVKTIFELTSIFFNLNGWFCMDMLLSAGKKKTSFGVFVVAQDSVSFFPSVLEAQASIYHLNGRVVIFPV